MSLNPTITSTTTTSSTTTSTKGNGSSQACAACKYQRRKCAPDCVLAPYFPHDTQRQFLNAHKLFGVSNITKILKNLDPRSKDEAMRSIIFQSDARASDPVGGCYRIIRELQHQIQYAEAELTLVQQHLAVCRAQHAPGSDVVNGVDQLSLYGNMEAQFLPLVQGQDQFLLQNDNHNSHSLQDDVCSWVVQDSTDFKPDVDVKPFLETHHQRNEAALRSIDDTIMLKEEDQYSMQQEDDSKDAPTLFRHADCCS